jgi:hypothetical protein
VKYFKGHVKPADAKLYVFTIDGHPKRMGRDLGHLRKTRKKFNFGLPLKWPLGYENNKAM